MQTITFHPSASPPLLRHGRRLRRAALPALGALAAGLAWVALLGPSALGGPATYLVVSGSSMEPTLRAGDLAVALRQASYRRGDVVVYRVPEGEPGTGSLVVHRVVQGSGRSGYVLRGDAKPDVDPWRPTDRDVLGKVRLVLPRGGTVLLALRSPLALALAAGLAAFLAVLCTRR